MNTSDKFACRALDLIYSGNVKPQKLKQGEHPYFASEPRALSKSLVDADTVGLGGNGMVNDMAQPFAAQAMVSLSSD